MAEKFFKQLVTAVKILRYVWKGIPLKSVIPIVKMHGSGNYQLVNQYRKTNDGWKHLPTGYLFNDDVEKLVLNNLDWWTFAIEHFKFRLETGKYQVESKPIHGRNIRSYIMDAGNLVSFKEIFYEGVYNFNTPKPTVMIDIGSNIAQAAMYFAANPAIEKVIGFEMVPATYEQALLNLALNPEIRSKIEIRNIALGTKDEVFPFMANLASSVVQNLETLRKEKPTEATVSSIQVNRIDRVFATLQTENANKSFLVKMDCEGSEYELIPMLFETKCLDKIDAIFLEWHAGNPDELTDWLRKAGFLSINLFLPVHNHPLGMIYAVKTGCQ